MRAGIVEDRICGPGIGQLAVPAKEALFTALAPWRELTKTVVLCGMAGSRNGLVEVPYLQTPIGVDQWRTGQTHLFADGWRVSVAPGLRTPTASASPDVMRGEETQIFGALCADPQLQVGRHLLILPGTHSKWVDIENGVISGFRTYMTGELFALLRNHSTLLRAGTGSEDGTDGFACGVDRATASSGSLARYLFETRSAQLLHARSQPWATEFLSGLLIGDEVFGELSHRPELQAARIIGEPQLTSRYRRCLTQIDIAEMDGGQCAIDGLLQLSRTSAESLT